VLYVDVRRTDHFVCIGIIYFTGSIARSAKLRHLSYSEGDFEVSRPAGATRCNGGKTENYTDFFRNINALQRRHEICTICTAFEAASPAKTWMDLLKELRSYGSFKLKRTSFPRIFSVPLRRNYMSDPQKF